MISFIFSASTSRENLKIQKTCVGRLPVVFCLHVGFACREGCSCIIAVMEKFKHSDINSMSIILEFIKDQLIPYISHIDSSKNMYDALINLF
jgi:hypothetical protein